MLCAVRAVLCAVRAVRLFPPGGSALEVDQPDALAAVSGIAGSHGPGQGGP